MNFTGLAEGLASGLVRSTSRVPGICALAVMLAITSRSAAGAETQGLKTINNPGGGHVVYGIFNQESTMQGAMAAMLRKMHEGFGERPQIGQFFQSRDGRSVGTFFNVTSRNQGGKHVTGMVIVTMPNGLKPAAAVLFDEASRFITTQPQLMQLLSDAFSHGGPGPGEGDPQEVSDASAAAVPHGAAGVVQPLRQEEASDNSASIGLPEGWRITGGGGGAIHAEGPKGESIHMGVINGNIYDPNNPQARSMIQYMSRGRTPFNVCPYTNDLVAGYQCVSRQNRQRSGLPPVSMHVISTKPMPVPPGRPPALLVTAQMNFNDGKGMMKSSILISTIRISGGASWALTVNQANIPEALADQEWPTIGAMANSYRQNGQVIQQQTNRVIDQIHANGAATTRRFEEHEKEVDQQAADFDAHNDAIDRQSKSFQNYQLDQSVLQDNEYPARGTLSNATADAYVKANPDRYQIVPQADWMRGRDY